MANIVGNEIRISADRKTIRRIREKLLTPEGNLSFACLIPEEKDNEAWYASPKVHNLSDISTRPDGKVFDWFAFRSAKWGPRWDVGDTEVVNDEPECIEVRFTTAWGSADPWYTTLKETFPEASIDYRACDEAMDWYYENGTVQRISDMVAGKEAELKERFIDNEFSDEEYDVERLKQHPELFEWHCVSVNDLFEHDEWTMSADYDEEQLEPFKKPEQ